MSWIEVLVEGSSDVPAIREILSRKFSLTERDDFRIHSHQGRGNLPSDVLRKPGLKNRSLLNQLPAKLRGFSTWFSKQHWVLVVIDADSTPCDELLRDLNAMLLKIPKSPRVLFAIAVKETESWFIADTEAIKKAYPDANLLPLKKIAPDTVCGAWEKLSESIHARSKDKTTWAEKIAPHLNLINPNSPSLKKTIEGIDKELKFSALRS